MEKTFETPINLTVLKTTHRWLKGLVWGFVGGLAGTIIMDLILMGLFLAFGLPAMTCFSIIGNTVAQLFWPNSTEITYANQLGIAAHYIVGPFIGMIFGSTIMLFKSLRVNTPQKCIFAAILYVEVLSQPLLALSSIILKMKPSITLLWYCGSFMMHLIWAVVMGFVVNHGLRLVQQGKKKTSLSPRLIQF